MPNLPYHQFYNPSIVTPLNIPLTNQQQQQAQIHSPQHQKSPAVLSSSPRQSSSNYTNRPILNRNATRHTTTTNMNKSPSIGMPGVQNPSMFVGSALNAIYHHHHNNSNQSNKASPAKVPAAASIAATYAKNAASINSSSIMPSQNQQQFQNQLHHQMNSSQAQPIPIPQTSSHNQNNYNYMNYHQQQQQPSQFVAYPNYYVYPANLNQYASNNYATAQTQPQKQQQQAGSDNVEKLNDMMKNNLNLNASSSASSSTMPLQIATSYPPSMSGASAQIVYIGSPSMSPNPQYQGVKLYF
jgi:hypothetical protein